MIEDRSYQARAIASARRSFVSGKRAVLLVAPTGAGKTTIAGLIVKGRIDKGGRVACYAHRRELVTQMADRFRAFGLDVGAHGENEAARVQVVSVQGALSRRTLPEADLVVLDEAHHYVADDWVDVPRTYAAAGALIVGLTATPERGDGKGLGAKGEAWGFDDLIVVSQIGELTDLGFLVPCDVLAPRTTPRKLALDPWDAYKRHAEGLSTVVFAPHVKAAEEFAAEFRNRLGVEAGVVHGDLALADRDGTLARFASGELRVVVNVNVLTEGWDCPRAKVCILARKIGSPSLFLQCVGRVLRVDGVTPRARLIDLSGNVALHGRPEDERIYSLDGAAVTRRGAATCGVRICKRCKAEIPPDVEACVECGRPLDELVTPHGEGIELDRFAWAKKLPANKRVERLARWYADGIVKGHKRGHAEHKYRAVFGFHAPTDVRVAAWKVAQEATAAKVPPIEEEETGT